MHSSAQPTASPNSYILPPAKPAASASVPRSSAHESASGRPNSSPSASLPASGPRPQSSGHSLQAQPRAEAGI